MEGLVKMKKKPEIEEFSADNALKMVRSGEFYLMHTSWFNPDTTGYLGENIEEGYPEHDFVLLDVHVLRWRDPKAVVGIVKDKNDRLDNLSIMGRAGL